MQNIVTFFKKRQVSYFNNIDFVRAKQRKYYLENNDLVRDNQSNYYGENKIDTI